MSAHRQHLKGAADLITTPEATRAGFVALALEKNRHATPIIAEARALKAALKNAARPADLLNLPDIQSALLTAAGVSDKSARHLKPAEKAAAMRGLIENFLEPAGEEWREELVHRFLLTRGDTLGGAMRNATGVIAQRNVVRALIAQFTITQTPYFWQQKQSGNWIQGDDSADLELQANALTWLKNGAGRALVFNLDVPLVGKNVDLCLLAADARHYSNFRIAIGSPEKYLALGELKGGVDPAGADEHWKTARTSLSRIREAFATKNLAPATFFLGYAIVPDMATEMWTQLEKGTLTNAANISDASQLASVVRWLFAL
jgi:hypothetical protein